MADIESFDYVIVGAGSAGGVLAARLTEDPDVSVLLLEAGGPDHRLDFRTQMPAALAYPLQSRTYNWDFKTEAEPYMDGRRMDCGRGKGLGGSSLINGMCYIRGNALDYDGWAQAPGLEHWRYRECLPYFRKAECYEKGPNAYHGGDGPLRVSSPKPGNNPLYHAFIEAGVQAGFPRTEDVNGFQQEGFGPMDRTTTSFGRRCSTSRAYLDVARKRSNLSVRTRALTDRIVIEGSRAVGVEYLAAGTRHRLRADREVLLCGGAIASPQILLRTGIGPAAELEALGIPVLQHLPGVGTNLQDHLELYIQYRCTQPVSLYPALKWWNKPKIGAEWLFLGRGIGASNQFEAAGFVRSEDHLPWPNIQYHFLPVAISYDGRNALQAHGFQAHVGSMRSPSTGSVSLVSADPREPPKIRFNYMAHEQDWHEFRACVRLTREIVAQRAMDEFRGEEISPGQAVRSDAEIDAFVRAHAETAYHPSCSCRMGEDESAVVDGYGRLHGLQGLRVIDASIMPRVATGNLNAPTIMMAEKLADSIRGRAPLPPSDAPYYVAGSTPARTSAS
jgi:choline dehydrogenase